MLAGEIPALVVWCWLWATLFGNSSLAGPAGNDAGVTNAGKPTLCQCFKPRFPFPSRFTEGREVRRWQDAAPNHGKIGK